MVDLDVALMHQRRRTIRYVPFHKLFDVFCMIHHIVYANNKSVHAGVLGGLRVNRVAVEVEVISSSPARESSLSYQLTGRKCERASWRHSFEESQRASTKKPRNNVNADDG